MERQQKKRVLVWLLRVFVILQLLFIVYVNFSKAYGLLDYDFALSFRHGMEIWKNGLFLKDFVYYSSLETDTVTFFASLLYLLTGNFSAALAAAHLAGYAAITLLLWDISRKHDRFSADVLAGAGDMEGGKLYPPIKEKCCVGGSCFLQPGRLAAAAAVYRSDSPEQPFSGPCPAVV